MVQSLATRLRKNTAGFTLIELLIVIAVIAILAVVAILAFGGSSNKAKDSNGQSLAKQVQNVVVQLSSSNGGFYDNVSVANLKAAEPQIPTTSASSAYLASAEAQECEGATTKNCKGYTLTVDAVTATDTDTFTITDAAGTTSYTQDVEGTQGNWPGT